MIGAAADRVAASRAAITREMLADAAPARDDGGAPNASPWRAVADWALDVAGARDGAQPARAGLRLACSLTESAVSPLAQRHPWALVGGAALGGVLLASARPWRWLMRPPVLTRLLTQVALAVVADEMRGRAPRHGDEPAARR